MAVRRWRNEVTVNSTTAGAQVHCDVAALNDGGYVIVWEDQGSAVIRGQVFNADGSARTGELVLSGANASAPDVCADEGGGFWVGYTQTFLGSNNVVARGYNASGANPVSVTIAASADAENQVSLDTRPGGGFLAAWHTDIGAGTVPYGFYNGVFQTLGNVGFDVTRDEFEPEIEVLSDGRFAIAYNYADANLRIAIKTAAGTTITDGIYNDEPLYADVLPRITALPGGRFVAVYGTFGSVFDGGAGVRGVLVDRNLEIVKSFDLHSTIDGSQLYPEVIGTKDGGFVAVWATHVDFGLGLQIRGQAFDPVGNRAGGEFIVSSLPFNIELFLAVNISLALLADGRIVVTWDALYEPGNGSDSDNFAIHSRIIDPRDGLVNGTSFADTLHGHDTVGDEINGFEGNDNIHAFGGNDEVFGGGGQDSITLGRGDDIAYGGNGNDTLSGVAGEDVLNGEADNDTLLGGKGTDELFGGAGIDTLNGGSEDDILSGGAGNDIIIGGPGADAFDGGTGTDLADYSGATAGVSVALNATFANTGEALGDTFVAVENLTGSSFNDILRGSSGNNALNGGLLNDRLEGLEGVDTMTGGLGNDTFFFNKPTDGGATGDVIFDFGSASGDNDRFEIRGANFNNQPAGALLANQFQSSTFDTAQTATVRFFFETDTGKLFWDRDGSAGAFGPVLLATLQAGATVVVGDFTII